MEMITPVFLIIGLAESCPCRNSLICLKDQTTIELCERESFRNSRGTDETLTNLQVSTLPHKTGATEHTVTNNDAASKSDVHTYENNKFHNNTQ